MKTTGFVSEIEGLPGYRGQIVHVERLLAQTARYGQLERPLSEEVRATLRQADVDRLYTHQTEAINAVRRGQHVMLSTGAASGKTVAYNVPVLEAMLADPQSRALYLFPTKALAQDQLRSLRELAGRGDVFGTYDGDTPRSARSRLRREASIIITNPDMLHVGILPNHTLWVDFFSNLRFVVIDEAHAYRGVFGSHVACVLRRLWRVCARYGAAPQFIACSATIGNPGQHFKRLVGTEAVVVDQALDGAPRGGKEFVLWNPPYLDDDRAKRRSANVEAAEVFARLVQAGIRCITFARARSVAELILVYARRILEREAPNLVDRVRAYRAGYRPELRREIERGLRRGGGLLGVTATSALELGIDIGDLEATVLVGYPGTIASLWQQAGRSGRGVRPALSVLIAIDDPLDQYYMRHPDRLFGRTYERALIDPGNPYILEQHLPCAARESPLSRGDQVKGPGAETRVAPASSPRRAVPGKRGARSRQSANGSVQRSPTVKPQLPAGMSQGDDKLLFGGGFELAVATLGAAGDLECRGDRWYSRPGAYPAEEVSLRAMAGSHLTLLDASQDYRPMEEMEQTSAPYRVHPGAIYLHQGESYRVRELDLYEGHAVLEPVQVNYYTQPRQLNDVHLLRPVVDKKVGRVSVRLGEVRVTQQVIGFRRVQRFREEVLSEERLDLPVQVYDTMAVWWDVPQWIKERVDSQRLDWEGGLHGVEHAVIGLLPLFAMCDRWDIGGLSTPLHPDTGQAQVFIYDGFPGGVGLAETGFEFLQALWRATYEVVRACPCQTGCPSCVQSPKCGNNNEPLDKGAAVVILAELVKRG